MKYFATATSPEMKNFNRGYVVIGDERFPVMYFPTKPEAEEKANELSNATDSVFNICSLNVISYSLPDAHANTRNEAIDFVKQHLRSTAGKEVSV